MGKVKLKWNKCACQVKGTERESITSCVRNLPLPVGSIWSGSRILGTIFTSWILSPWPWGRVHRVSVQQSVFLFARCCLKGILAPLSCLQPKMQKEVSSNSGLFSAIDTLLKTFTTTEFTSAWPQISYTFRQHRTEKLFVFCTLFSTKVCLKDVAADQTTPVQTVHGEMKQPYTSQQKYTLVKINYLHCTQVDNSITCSWQMFPFVQKKSPQARSSVNVCIVL